MERELTTMTRKAVFLDVDGTLIDDYGRVPDSAVRAVREARRNGHLVFLCTGRSMVELSPGVLDVGFDGFVVASGAYVQVGSVVATTSGPMTASTPAPRPETGSAGS
jgi:hydroxymethylpyrimidine pyrophosphatase-like HAD family hydrolase